MKHHDELLLRASPESADGTKATAPSFDGIWVNELRSTMDLKVTANAIAGIYTSAVSANGSPVVGRLVGFVNGDLISFVVTWPVGAITAWVGQLLDKAGQPELFTLWQMTTNIPDAQEPEGMWASVYAGTDTFRRK